jgi:hypothetical protein
MTVYLDLNNKLRLFQLMGESCVLLFQFSGATAMRIGLSGHRSSLLGNKALGDLASP